MLIVTTIQELDRERNQLDSSIKIGFVPTMGALHLGHQSLIQRAVKETDFVIVSIFVNPLQFGKNEDLNQYPRTLQQDSLICQALGVNLLFTPSEMEIHPSRENITLVTPPSQMTSVLCGKYRPGHFIGVATIIVKLFNLVRPNVAYFGEKDAQQVAIIKKMTKDLNIPVKVQSCPTIREDSGLALSSRNHYLTAQQREDATILYKSLSEVRQIFQGGERNTVKLLQGINNCFSLSNLKLQYAEIVHPDTLQPLTKITDSALIAIAAYCGDTRLIDNLMLTVSKPIIALDGPAGAGKSTVSRRLAQDLGYLYLDTGAMYRALTWLVMKKNIDINDESAIALLVNRAEIELLPRDDLQTPVTVKINQEDVTQAIRTSEVTKRVSTIAAHSVVREKMVRLQQEYGKKGGIVAEGRDIGTNVFPHAQLKIFLTATPAARAKRRLIDLENQGETHISLTDLIAEIEARDYQDSTRLIAPLKKADDATEIITDDLTIDQVVEKIKGLIDFS